MTEKDIERRLVEGVNRNGGICAKWVSPGHRGVPDRIILMPGGVVAFAELKSPGARIARHGLQRYWQEQLRRFGFISEEINSPEQVDDLVIELRRRSEIAIRAAKLRQYDEEPLIAEEACRLLGEWADPEAEKRDAHKPQKEGRYNGF